MLLTKQQKYLLAVLEKLGCAEQRQLAALLQKMFAFSFLDDAVRVTNACVRQMQMGGLLQISDNIVSHCGERAVSQQIEAIDVMLELSAAQPESFYAVDKHTLLRFSLGEASFKQFVIVSGSDPPPEHEIRRDEKTSFCCLMASDQKHFRTPDPLFLQSGKRTARTASLPENNF